MSTNLICVNLLPEERRPQPSRLWAKFGVLAGMLVITTVCILASVVINVMVLQEGNALRKSEERLAALQPQLDEHNRLTAEEDLLQTKQGIIDTLILHRLEWAPKLNLISDLLPDQIWLERVFLRRVSKRVRVQVPSQTGRGAQPIRQRTTTIDIDYLNINAVSHRLSQDTELVAQMIENLQTSREFMGEDFERVEMVGMVHEQYVPRDKESPEVVRFEVECKIASEDEEEEVSS